MEREAKEEREGEAVGGERRGREQGTESMCGNGEWAKCDSMVPEVGEEGTGEGTKR